VEEVFTMKKYILMLFLFFLIGTNFFAYAYIAGKNIISPNEFFVVSGFGENKLQMTVYQIKDPLKLLLEEKQLSSLEKKMIVSKTIKSDDDGRISHKEVLKDYGVYLVELVSTIKDNSKDLTRAIIIVTDLDFISVYDGEQAKITPVDLITGKNREADIYTVDNSDNFTAFPQKAELSINGLNLKRVVIKSNNQYALKEFYPLYKSYKDNPARIITDKPVYLPGQTIYYKTSIFLENEGVYTLCPQKDISIKLVDPVGKELFNVSAKTDENGSSDGSFKITDSAPIGYYTINVSSDEKPNQINSYGFFVEDYVKPEYSIKLTTDKEKYFSNEEIIFKTTLSYLNNTPVKNAQIAFYIYYEPFSYEQGSELVYHGIKFSNDGGVLEIPFKVKKGHRGSYRFQIVVSDENQRQMEENLYVSIYPGNYIITPKNHFLSFIPNVETTISGSITDIDNNPINGDILLEIKDDKSTIRTSTLHAVNGSFDFKCTLIKEGGYTFIYKYQESQTEVYAYCSERSSYDEDVEIADVTLKDRTISFNIKGYNNANAYLYLAGKKLYDNKNEIIDSKRTISLSYPEKIIENSLFIQGFIFSKGKLLRISKEVRIRENKDLSFDFTVNADKNSYKPGEEVTITINSAEDGIFSLSVVDEAIFKMIDRQTDPVKELYGDYFYPEVSIESSSRYYYGYMAKNPDLTQTHKFASYKGAGEIKNNTREYFPDTALWLPTVKTTDGKAVIKFKNPDSVTSWRITAEGISNYKLASQKSNFISTKNFYARPLLPNFCYRGDNFSFPVVVYNNTEEELFFVYKAMIDNPGLSVTPTNGGVIVGANSSKVLNFNVDALNFGNFNFTFHFDSWKVSDSIKLPFEVKLNQLKTDIRTIQYVQDGDTLKKGVQARKVNLEKIIRENIEYLISYPYGCTEQTMSAFYPALMSKSLNLEIENTQDIILKSVQRLYKYQHDDGGWGWWMNDLSDPGISAYVMEGLLRLKNTGYYLPQTVLKNALSYLKSNILDGYIYHVLKLWGEVPEDFVPTSLYDKLFFAYHDDTAYNEVLSMMQTHSEAYFINYSDESYYHTQIEMNAILLDLLLTKNAQEDKVIGMVKYLLANKKSLFWNSTKDSARTLLALIKFIQNYSDSFSGDVSLTDEFDFILSDTLIKGNGLIETKKTEYLAPVKNNSGIDIVRSIFKRYELPVSFNSNDYIADAFIPIESNKVPSHLEIISLDDFYRNRSADTLIWNISSTKPGTFIEHMGKTVSYTEEMNFTINGIRFPYPQRFEIISDKGFIYSYDSLICYNFTDSSTCLISDSAIKDYKIYNGKKYILQEDSEKKQDTLMIEDRFYQFGKSFQAIDIFEDKVFLHGDGLYLFDESSQEKLKKIFPVSGQKILSLDENSIMLYGNIRFEGNSSYAGKTGIYKITFKTEKPSLYKGDILKTQIFFKTEIPSYIAVEDYLSGSTQVLTNYSEKVINTSNKFDYYWYKPWDNWYSSKEIRKDRVAFFQNGFETGSFEYYSRLTHSGLFRIMPAQAYSMYWITNFGTSDSIEMNVK